MNNKEFEKKLEKNIKTFNEVPISIDEKIQKAFEKIEENERWNNNMNKQSKFKLSKILSIAASLVVGIFLVGNGIAYAKGENNIYSWILEKIGIQKEYEEIKTEINQTVESNGIKVTLIDCGYDSNRFIVGYKVEDLEGKIKNINKKYQSTLEDGVNSGIYDSMYFSGDNTFYTDKGQKKVNPDDNMGLPDDYVMSEQISDTEFMIYETVVISEVDWDGKITDVDIQLKSLNFLAKDEQITGNWNFKVSNLNDKYKDISICTLNINKKIDDELIIGSIRVENSGIFGKIFIEYKTETEDSDDCYLFKVVDKDNKALGEFNLPIAEGMQEPIAYKYLSKLEENEKYKILIYNNDNYDDIKERKSNPITEIEFIYKKDVFKNFY